MNRFCYNEKCFKSGKDFGSPVHVISSAFTVLFLQLLLSNYYHSDLWEKQNSEGRTLLKTQLIELRMIKAKRSAIGLPVEKNLQQDITTWNLNFTCREEEIMSNVLAIPNQKSCLFSELKPLKEVSFDLPHRSRLPPNRYRGVKQVFNSLSKVVLNGYSC